MLLETSNRQPRFSIHVHIMAGIKRNIGRCDGRLQAERPPWALLQAPERRQAQNPSARRSRRWYRGRTETKCALKNGLIVSIVQHSGRQVEA